MRAPKRDDNSFAAMLDEMMGEERNVDLDKVTGKKRHFTDDNVDKHYVVGCSPYQLFRHQAKNEGYLPDVALYRDMICDDALREEYRALPQEEKDRLGYEYDAYVLLTGIVEKCDARVRKAREQVSGYSRSIADRVNERRAGWQSRIDAKMRASETAGEAGDVDACEAHVAAAQKLRDAMEEDCASFKRELSRFDGSQAVCEVTGAIIASDATEQNDRANHFAGKAYVGWKRIREFVKELERKGVRPPPRARVAAPAAAERRGGDGGGAGDPPPREERRREQRGADRRRDGSRERERGRGWGHDDRDRDRDRDRDWDRDRDRRREPSRDRQRARSRDRDADYRGRDHRHHPYDRDRDRRR